MSVGKASIKRAASAGTRKTAAKAAANTQMEAGAAAVSGLQAEPAVIDVKQSVLTPMNCEEIQAKFLSGKSEAEDENRPVRLTEDMPVHLL